MGGPRLSIEDRQIIEQMTIGGYSAAVIARRIGCASRTVERWRTAHPDARPIHTNGSQE